MLHLVIINEVLSHILKKINEKKIEFLEKIELFPKNRILVKIEI